MNVFTENTAPWGSLSTATLTTPASNGGTVIVPPSCAALSAIASVSATANVTLQCGGTSSGDWPFVIGSSHAIASSKPSGAPCAA